MVSEAVALVALVALVLLLALLLAMRASAWTRLTLKVATFAWASLRR